MTLEEFREDLLNEINSTALIDSIYPIDAFIDYCKDILINDFGLISDLNHTFFDYKTTNNQFRNMHLDASYLELSINTAHLLYADFNPSVVTYINNEFIQGKATLLTNFVVNALKGFFKNSADSDETTQFGRELKKNVELLNKLHLIIVSTNLKSARLKTTISLKPVEIGTKQFDVDLTLLDIENIFQTKSATFKREDIIINTSDFGISNGISCIKADVMSEDYDSYLAVVPGKFLSDIYLKYSARLLESNVRSFLNTRGEINKGILYTIMNNKSRFFAYNNGIATTADSINLEKRDDGMYITGFTNLQIINGGQTTASLASSVIKYNANLDGIFVQMKLTIIKNESERSELIRLISKYANKQNKVTNADLNSNHPFYNRIEEFSRKVKTPILANVTIQSIWFFERTRGQYDQARMQVKTKRDRDLFELQFPKKQKFTKTDLAKYINAADMKPYYVAWGAEVNMTRFQANMEKEWTKNDLMFNEVYYKELIAKAILYKEIEKIVSESDWYQANRGYRAQIVPYTFSKFVYSAQQVNLSINYKKIWESQTCLAEYEDDLSKIAKIVYDLFNNPQRQILNIGEYAKREICWDNLKKISFSLSELTKSKLISEEEKDIENKMERSNQKLTNEVSTEIAIFNLGIDFWKRLIKEGKQLDILNDFDVKMCELAIKFINQEYRMLSKKQVKSIWNVKEKMDSYINN